MIQQGQLPASPVMSERPLPQRRKSVVDFDQLRELSPTPWRLRHYSVLAGYTSNASGDIDIQVVDLSITTAEAACEQLQAALMKCDGVPEDFVTGTAREELAAMIEGLLADLACG